MGTKDQHIAKKSERGVNLMEYLMLIMFIVVVCIASVRFMGNTSSVRFSTATSSMH